MFDRLSDSFNGVFRKLSGKGSISEGNVRDAMEDVRTALLEADVHYDVVQRFCEGVLEDALGQEVTKSLKPGEEMIGIVHERLIDLLGGRPEEGAPEPGVVRVSPGPTVVMMCGLQGSGKTTTCGKLAAWLKKRGRSVMLCAADLQRPAAVEQLEIVAQQVNDESPGGAQVEFYGEPDQVGAYGERVGVAVDVCQRALQHAIKSGVDTLILDTAGRLHINDDLMGELGAVHRSLRPHQIFLVVDAMTGQDAVNSAKAFHEKLEVDGVILTKFDSDSRGGAALSIRQVTGAPLTFVGTGEKMGAIEAFHAERMAGRILGMGDVVSLVEKAQQEVDEAEAERMQEKMAKGELSMDDFLGQLRAIRRMGPLKQIMGMLPGVGSMLKDVQVEDNQLDRIEATINSMTKAERSAPRVINHSRRKRIAQGAGTDSTEVGQLVKQFDMIAKMTKQMSSMSTSSRMAAAKQLSEGGMPGIAGMPGLPSSKGSTKSGSAGKFKQRKGGKGGKGKKRKR